MSVPFIPDTVHVLGVEVPSLALLLVAIVVLIVAFAYVRAKCKVQQNPLSEKFKWPSSSKFLKTTDPAHPPKFAVEKYEDPIRADTIPTDSETKWTVMYQPRGGRDEVKQHMYLRFRDGAVYGVGYEDYRRLCKISGRYSLNRGANQTVLAMSCNFWNERATVMFHGWGNGTGLVGNCYVREMDHSSPFTSMSGMRPHGGCTKYTGSFLMLKMAGMGAPQLRAQLHTRRVQQWAGKLFPDDSLPPAGLGARAPTGAPRDNSKSPDTDGLVTVEGDHPRPSAPSPQQQRKRSSLFSSGSSRGKDVGGGSRTTKRLLELLPSFGKRKNARELQSGTSPSSTYELPPWVRQRSGPESPVGERGDDGDGDPYTSKLSASSSARRTRRPSLPPVDTSNYLRMEGVPGRSGSMV